jgi:hypothetical protein|tara:strand:+ start:17883 stop:18089 length:207 start_codon:yes stop_codon:yes gene_type:complete
MDGGLLTGDSCDSDAGPGGDEVGGGGLRGSGSGCATGEREGCLAVAISMRPGMTQQGASSLSNTRFEE